MFTIQPLFLNVKCVQKMDLTTYITVRLIIHRGVHSNNCKFQAGKSAYTAIMAMFTLNIFEM